MSTEVVSGYVGDKKGVVKLCMNSEVIRVKRYYCPKERLEIVQKWLIEVRNIMDVNQFSYIIVPQQGYTKKWRKSEILKTEAI